MLSDEEIDVAHVKFAWVNLNCTEHRDAFARAIESAATAPLLAEIERLTLELEEARKALETARNWIADRPDMRQCSAGKIVAELTRALSVDAAIKEQT